MFLAQIRLKLLREDTTAELHGRGFLYLSYLSWFCIITYDVSPVGSLTNMNLCLVAPHGTRLVTLFTSAMHTFSSVGCQKDVGHPLVRLEYGFGNQPENDI